MKTQIYKYVKGEDELACECFERLWQDTLATYEPKKPIALILPCVWGKPYFESYLIQYILGGVLACSENLIKEVEAYSNIQEHLNTLEYHDIFDVVEIWHMSSCGFVPFEKQYVADETDGVAYFAYDWDSSRASSDDVLAWFKWAEKRTKEWVETFAQKYYRTFVYLREGSKSQQVFSPYFFSKEEAHREHSIVNAFLNPLQAREDYEEPSTFDKWITLNGRRTEVDIPLLAPFSLSWLSTQLTTAIGDYLKSLED